MAEMIGFEHEAQNDLTVQHAGMISRDAKMFVSEIMIRNGQKSANALKMMHIISMGIRKGDRLNVEVSGEDQEEAAAQMQSRFIEVI